MECWEEGKLTFGEIISKFVMNSTKTITGPCPTITLLRPRISWTDKNEMIWLVEHCKRFLLNTFGGLANTNHSIRIFIQNFFIFAYVPDTILTVLMAKLYIKIYTCVAKKLLTLTSMIFLLALKSSNMNLNILSIFSRNPANLADATNRILIK